MVEELVDVAVRSTNLEAVIEVLVSDMQYRRRT